MALDEGEREREVLYFEYQALEAEYLFFFYRLGWQGRWRSWFELERMVRNVGMAPRYVAALALCFTLTVSLSLSLIVLLSLNRRRTTIDKPDAFKPDASTTAPPALFNVPPRRSPGAEFGIGDRNILLDLRMMVLSTRGRFSATAGGGGRVSFAAFAPTKTARKRGRDRGKLAPLLFALTLVVLLWHSLILRRSLSQNDDDDDDDGALFFKSDDGASIDNGVLQRSSSFLRRSPRRSPGHWRPRYQFLDLRTMVL